MNYLGFFGKLPEKGDFVQDGLEMSERETWDDWLQRGMSNARQSLEEKWGTCYVCGSVWRFLIRQGGSRRNGVLMLSRDRVGREFPFLVLFEAAVDTETLSGVGIEDVDAALSVVERMVSAAFGGSLPVDLLAVILRSISQPPERAWSTRTAKDGLTCYGQGAAEQVRILPAAVLDSLLGDDEAGQGRSLWWQCNANGVVDRVLFRDGTIGDQLFYELLSPDRETPKATDRAQDGVGAEDRSGEASGAATKAAPKITAKPAGDDPVDFDSLLG